MALIYIFYLQGFPRADVDVHAVRNDRHRLALLTNDHKALTQQIEPLMYALHAAAREAREAQQASSAAPAQPPAAPAAPPVAAAAAPAAPVPLPRPQQPAQQPLRPFAVVDEVAGEDAPAARAGVQLGDQLCTFGEASGASGAPVAALMQQVRWLAHLRVDRGDVQWLALCLRGECGLCNVQLYADVAAYALSNRTLAVDHLRSAGVCFVFSGLAVVSILSCALGLLVI